MMNYKNDKANAFGGAPSQSIDDDIFGASTPPASGRVVAKPIEIMDIYPDLRQPRRAIPAGVRGQWDGSPAQVGDLLSDWKIAVQAVIQERIPPLKDLLTGTESIPEEMGKDTRAMVQSFVALISLAGNIYADGLINPITVYEAGGRVNVLTGERRWLAYHLLYAYVDKQQFAKVPATVVDYNVRQQVAENMVRENLNAIGRARCFALVCMDIMQREGIKTFRSYEEMVKPGGCDKAFYAQVEKTPYGFGPEVMNAMNVNSRQSLNNYLDMLKLSDDLWNKADEEDWSIRDCLTHIKPITPSDSNVKSFDNSPQQSGHKTLSEGAGRDFTSGGSNVGSFDFATPTGGARIGATPTPSPSPKASGEGNLPGVRVMQASGRPKLTKQSSEDDWMLYDYAPHPSEMEAWETWGDAEEAQAALVDAQALGASGDGLKEIQGELDKTPLSYTADMVGFFDGLAAVARALGETKSARMVDMVKKRSTEDIRLFLAENPGGVEAFEAKLREEFEQAGSLLDSIAERFNEYMGYLLTTAKEIKERM